MRKFDVRQLLILVILEFVDHHCKHLFLGHCVVHTRHLTIAITIRVVGAVANFPSTKKLVDGMRKLSAKLEAVVREYLCCVGIPRGEYTG